MIGAGFLFLLRLDTDTDFWTEVFPALFLIAFGVACIAAPLTTAVLASVDARHAAVASGLNSAVARTGGTLATALLGTVFAAHGPQLLEAFHVAAIACAVVSVCAGAFAFGAVGTSAPRKTATA